MTRNATDEQLRIAHEVHNATHVLRSAVARASEAGLTVDLEIINHYTAKQGVKVQTPYITAVCRLVEIVS